MPNYIRAIVPGGTFFLTVVTHERRCFLTDSEARRILRDCFRRVQRKRPFTVEAFALLPDHFHTVWSLPDGDSDYSTRLRLIKGAFTHLWRPRMSGSQTEPLIPPTALIWQPRFWEHTVRNEEDFQRICDYIHWNPVRHGLVQDPHRWPHTSLQRFVRAGWREPDWGALAPSDLESAFERAAHLAGE